MRGGTRLALVGVAASLVLGLAAGAGIGWSDGVSRSPRAQVVGLDFRISGGAAVAWEQLPAVAYNSTEDEYLVVWVDARNEWMARGPDIYGQRLAADGSRVGANFRISSGAATGFENDPAVAYNSTANQYLVVWDDTRDSPTRGSDIYGQRLAADGSRWGTNRRISGGAATGNEFSPAVVYSATEDEYLVVWVDERNSATRGLDIYGQRVGGGGGWTGPNFRISGGAATAWESGPAVAYDSTANQYLVVWEDTRNYATRKEDIYGQRLAPDGSRVGANRRISGGAATATDAHPAVAYSSTANQYLVAWQDLRNVLTRGPDIYGQRVAGDGNRVGANFRISGGAATATEGHPAVAYGSTANQYLVAWQDLRNDATRKEDIYGQRVTAAGSRVGGNFLISGPAATDRESSTTAAYNSTSNQYLIAWKDERDYATRQEDIYGRRVAG